MSTNRDVSPIGHSRFEQPYVPPKSTKTTPASSPTESTYPNLPYNRHHVRGSNASTVETRSIARTSYSTAPSSIDTTLDRGGLEKELKGLHSASRPGTAAALPEEDDEYDEYDPERPSSGWYSDKSVHEHPLESDQPPSAEVLKAVHDFPIYDSKSQATTFGALIDPATATHQRQLIIFVRYFYCPACTAYLKSLTEGITLQEYLALPTSTSITIIGCGAPDLISHYKQFTGCPFTMYADPTRSLFKQLGMGISFNVGKRKPEYMSKGLLGASKDEIGIISKSLKDPEGIKKRDLLRGGHPMQIGGEFLFDGGVAVWAHRMRDYRGHSEIATLRKLVGLDG